MIGNARRMASGIAGTVILGGMLVACGDDRAVLENADGDAILRIGADVNGPRFDDPLRGDRTQFVEQFVTGDDDRRFGVAYLYSGGGPPNLAVVRREVPGRWLFVDDFPELEEQTFQGVPAYAYRCDVFDGPEFVAAEVGLTSQAVVVGTDAGVALLMHLWQPSTVDDFEGWESFLATIDPVAGPPQEDVWLEVDGSRTEGRSAAPIESCRNMDIPIFLE